MKKNPLIFELSCTYYFEMSYFYAHSKYKRQATTIKQEKDHKCVTYMT
jgi:hypothetical protein